MRKRLFVQKPKWETKILFFVFNFQLALAVGDLRLIVYGFCTLRSVGVRSETHTPVTLLLARSSTSTMSHAIRVHVQVHLQYFSFHLLCQHRRQRQSCELMSYSCKPNKYERLTRREPHCHHFNWDDRCELCTFFCSHSIAVVLCFVFVKKRYFSFVHFTVAVLRFFSCIEKSEPSEMVSMSLSLPRVSTEIIHHHRTACCTLRR